MLRDQPDRLLARFRIAKKMGPYVLRIRLRVSDFDFGTDPDSAVAFTKHVEEMRRVLVSKGIAVPAADKAILKTLGVAVDFQVAHLQKVDGTKLRTQAERALDTLIRNLRLFSNAVARLPPTAREQLNAQVCPILREGSFDTEVFIDVLEAVAAALLEISPRRLAEDVASIVYPETDRRPPMIEQWETMPAGTRLKVEDLMQQRQHSSLQEWLIELIELLDEHRPVRKRGAPRAIMSVFVSRVAEIWRSLGLEPGLAYYFLLPEADGEVNTRGGRKPSRFQRYCHAALCAFGDTRMVSARQVNNYKNPA